LGSEVLNLHWRDSVATRLRLGCDSVATRLRHGLNAIMTQFLNPNLHNELGQTSLSFNGFIIPVSYINIRDE